ncbi:PREDICTED: C-C chemokine receptor type 10 [Gekko japonicus]|uniref:C-C chemokine receptor type 10 n=1 Tax=Gekko japonicus TaxID=146911 RepID=A0ABM1L7Z2_GEKJA|nr:PREDICTED: C-C chemokine receptor type 10 [Gekko japonicus]
MNDQSPQVQELSPWTDELPISTEWYSWDYDAETPALPELCEKEAVRAVARVYLPAMAVLFCLLGVPGNGMLLLIQACYRRGRSLGDTLLLHLAASDLLLLLTLPVGVAGMVGSWPLGSAPCQALQGLHALTSYSGFLFLMGLTVDRYVAIAQAPTAHRLRPVAARWAGPSAGLVWLLSAALALPQFLYARVEDHGGFPLCRVAVVTAAVSLAQVGLGFVLPLVLMGACYAAIARTLLSSPCAQSQKALQLILALVLLFVVLQLPHALLTVLDTADLLGRRSSNCPAVLRRDLALLITSGLALARCCLNPVFHAFLGVRFRRDLQQLGKDAGCRLQGACCGRRAKRRGSRQASLTTAYLEGTSGAP